jgi:Fe2+ or Zn2+ uptake regulation protein
VKTPTELTELFRTRGLKVTPQRQMIFRLLHGNGVHPTAESLYAAARDEMPTISLRTVETMGEIQQLDVGTGSSRFDPNVEVHHHLVCDLCGKVRDLYADFDISVPRGRAQGFTVKNAEVVFRGLCDTCKKKEGDHG